MNSAKELKKSLTELKVFTPEEITAKVAAAIEAGTHLDDLQAPAISEELFNKALSAIDAVLNPAEKAINKSEIDAAAASVDAALDDKDGPDLKSVLQIIKSHQAAMVERFDRQDEVIRTVLRAVKDMFVSTSEGVNAISKSHAAEFSQVRESITAIGKAQVKPQVRPGYVAPYAGAQGAAAATEISKSENKGLSLAQAKVKIYDIIKSETKNPETSTARRERLALAATNLHGANTIEVVNRVARELGVTLD